MSTTRVSSTKWSLHQCNSMKPHLARDARPNTGSTPRRFCSSSASTGTTSPRPKTAEQSCSLPLECESCGGRKGEAMTAGVEQLEFQAEARQLLDLMVHSVYSEKDSFLRELISNASDALDKLRIEAFRNKDLEVDTSDLHIDIEVDKDARTLTVRDNGIGMTRAEVVDLIGTLAKSGTAELREQLREAQTAKNTAVSEELIGQFGIGFYSTFMVADKVQLLTRKAGESAGTRWDASGDRPHSILSV